MVTKMQSLYYAYSHYSFCNVELHPLYIIFKFKIVFLEKVNVILGGAIFM